MDDRSPVGRSEDSKLLGHARESFEGKLRLVVISGVASEMMQSHQRNRRHRISRRRRRILQWLAPGRQHAQAFALADRLAVKQSS